MDNERLELINKRNRVRKMLRYVADCTGLNLYFAQRQRYDEIMAIFINEAQQTYHQIIVRLDEVEDFAGIYNNLRDYLELDGGEFLNSSRTFCSGHQESYLMKILNPRGRILMQQLLLRD